MNYKTYILEAVYGHQAIVFHRTGSQPEYADQLWKAINRIEDYKKEAYKQKFITGIKDSFNIVNSIISKGFNLSQTNTGQLYGKGVYCTYDLESQLGKIGELNGEEMYGKIIIKSKLNLINFLILDYTIAQRVYGKNHTLKDQCIKLGLKNVLEDLEDETTNLYRKVNSPSFSNPYFNKEGTRLSSSAQTSEIALLLTQQYHIDMKVSGILFTGYNDGHVVVCYEPSLLVPFSFAITNKNEFVVNWVSYNKDAKKETMDKYIDSLMDELGFKQDERSRKTNYLNDVKITKVTSSFDNWVEFTSKRTGKLGIINLRTKEILVDNIDSKYELKILDAYNPNFCIYTLKDDNNLFALFVNKKQITDYQFDKVSSTVIKNIVECRINNEVTIISLNPTTGTKSDDVVFELEYPNDGIGNIDLDGNKIKYIEVYNFKNHIFKYYNAMLKKYSKPFTDIKSIENGYIGLASDDVLTIEYNNKIKTIKNIKSYELLVSDDTYNLILRTSDSFVLYNIGNDRNISFDTKFDLDKVFELNNTYKNDNVSGFIFEHKIIFNQHLKSIFDINKQDEYTGIYIRENPILKGYRNQFQYIEAIKSDESKSDYFFFVNGKLKKQKPRG